MVQKLPYMAHNWVASEPSTGCLLDYICKVGKKKSGMYFQKFASTANFECMCHAKLNRRDRHIGQQRVEVKMVDLKSHNHKIETTRNSSKLSLFGGCVGPEKDQCMCVCVFRRSDVLEQLISYVCMPSYKPELLESPGWHTPD